MKKYCLDTSGLSNPLEAMPEDIHVTLWEAVQAKIVAGEIAVTAEILGEMKHIEGAIGDCLKGNEGGLLLEVNGTDWPVADYIEHATRMQVDHAKFIRENLNMKKGTIGMNDLSIIALAKAMALPVISMEKRKAHQTDKARQIPDICDIESVPHMTFSDFLRAEGIKV